MTHPEISATAISYFVDAAAFSDFDHLRSLHRRYGDALLDLRKDTGRCALLEAAGYGGDENIVRYLVSHGADLCARTALNNQTVLMEAVYYKREPVLRFLLTQAAATGADLIDLQNNQGKTALHMACENGFIVGIQLLLEAGANPGVLDQSQQTAFNKAAAYDDKNHPDTPLLEPCLRAHQEHCVMQREMAVFYQGLPLQQAADTLSSTPTLRLHPPVPKRSKP